MRQATRLAAALGSALLLLAGCSSDKDDGERSPAAGTAVLRLSGGTSATTASGGDGGNVWVQSDAGGGVKLLRAGSVDTSFPAPTVALSAPVDLGTRGVVVAESTTVGRLVDGDADPGTGVLYQVGQKLYRGDGAGTVPAAGERVTGLAIRAGATLVLPLVNDWNGNGVRDSAGLELDHDLEVAGVLRAADITTGGGSAPDSRFGAAASPRDSGALFLTAAQVFVRATGAIDLRGGDAPAGGGERGGDGGALSVDAGDLLLIEGVVDVSGGRGDGEGPGGAAGIWSTKYTPLLALSASSGSGGGWGGGGGQLVNRGRIFANGGDGGRGGPAAQVDLFTAGALTHTGEIAANGGAGSTAAGGRASASVYLVTHRSGVYSSGPISARGGSGATGGAAGGAVGLLAGTEAAGDLVVSSLLDVSGAAATEAGEGGSAGTVDLAAYGAIASSARIVADGGDARGTGRYGGQGGALSVANYAPYGGAQPMRPLRLGGDLSARGGAGHDGGEGGQGGRLEVYQDGWAPPGDAGIELVGYALIDVSGGVGTRGGGDVSLYGTALTLYTGSGYDPASDASLPAGSIVNEVDVLARGGDAIATGHGGGGRDVAVRMECDDTRYSPTITATGAGQGLATIQNSGNVDMTGGQSHGQNESGYPFAGGGSGGIELLAAGGVRNSGRIVNVGGGADKSNGGAGNYFPTLFMSAGDVVNEGEIVTRGGAGLHGGRGSDGWSALTGTGLYAGGQVVNTATLDSRGGDAIGADGRAGGGGRIELLGQSRPTASSGRLDVRAGAGIDRTIGEIWIDFVNVTPASGMR